MTNHTMRIIIEIKKNRCNRIGEMNGYWEEWFYDGKLKSKGFYINGERDGIWESYYGNGNLYSKGSYKDGKPDGIWEEYYPNGQLWIKGFYKNGVLICEV